MANEFMQQIMETANQNLDEQSSTLENYHKQTRSGLLETKRELEAISSIYDGIGNKAKSLAKSTEFYKKEYQQAKTFLEETKNYITQQEIAYRSIHAVSKLQNKSLSESAKIHAENLEALKKQTYISGVMAKEKAKELSLQISLTKEIGNAAKAYEKLEAKQKSSFEFLKKSMSSGYLQKMGSQDPMLHAALTGQKSSQAPIRSTVGATLHKNSYFNKEFREDVKGEAGLKPLVGGLNSLIIAGGMASNAVFGMADSTMKAFNQMWGGVKGTLNMMKDGVSKAFGAINTKAGAAVGGIGESIINAILFQYEDSFNKRILQHRSKISGREDVNEGQYTSLSNRFGRDTATKLIGSRIDLGSEQLSTDQMKAMGSYTQAMGDSFTETLGTVMSFKSKGTEAFDTVVTSLRAIKKSAKDTQLPFKQLVKQYSDASQQLRIFNVDQKIVSGTIASVAAQTEKLAAVGVDTRTQTGALTKDLLDPSRLSQGAMAYYSSKNQGYGPIEGLMRGIVGDTTIDAVKKSGSWKDVKGKTDLSTSGASKRIMLGQGEMMLDATKDEKDPIEAGLMRYQFAKAQGMSEVGARTMMQIEDMDDLKQLMKENPEIANAALSTNDILSNISSSAALSERLQRGLTQIVQGILAYIITIPDSIVLGMKETLYGLPVIGDTEKQKGAQKKRADHDVLRSEIIDSIIGGYEEGIKPVMKKIGAHGVGGLLTRAVNFESSLDNVKNWEGSVGSPNSNPDSNKVKVEKPTAKDVRSIIELAFGGHAGKEKKALGGPVSSIGSYLVGELGPEIFTPSTSGKISSAMDTKNLMEKAQSFTPKIPDTLQSISDKYKPQLPGGSGSSMNMSGESVVNLNVSGLNKEQLISEVVKQVRERLW